MTEISPYLLLALGYFLIFLEFYLPGAVLGIAGGIFVFASLTVFLTLGYPLWADILYIVVVFVGLVATVKFAIWKIRSAKPSRSIYSDDAQTGYVASSYDKNAIGKQGIVVTDLKPGGHIMVEGKRCQAISLAGYLSKGTEVEVVGGQEESLMVKPLRL